MIYSNCKHLHDSTNIYKGEEKCKQMGLLENFKKNLKRYYYLFLKN